MTRNIFFLLALFCSTSMLSQVSIPAYTAYIEPYEKDPMIDRMNGIYHWKDPEQKVKFFFKINKKGKLDLSVKAAFQGNEACPLQAVINHETFDLNISPTDNWMDFQTFEIGTIKIKKTGYYCLSLTGKSDDLDEFCRIQSLELDGKAVKGIHFNTKARRNAASVHLRYPIPEGEKAEWFYNEIEVPPGKDPVHSYYCANGFSRGYFGIQVNKETERRIIFSVWDSSDEQISREKVGLDDRVQELDKGENVVTSGFGNEGTGAHSHLVYDWKPGQNYGFLLHAKPINEYTAYTAYFYDPMEGNWLLIASFLAPKDGGYLSKLYSFVENFWGSTGQLERKAYYSNQWIRTNTGRWIELKKASFTHDPTGMEERFDYGAGLYLNSFYLSNGGFLEQGTAMGDTFSRKHSEIPVHLKNFDFGE